MDASSEVMQPVATPVARQVQPDGRGRCVDAGAPRVEVARQRGQEPRLSEDPMRRTDRYRLVMPYANRV
jgi:hypothetical protein